MVRWLLLFVALTSGAMAAESAPVRSSRVVATLVSDTDGVAPGQAFRLGLRLRVAPGWHVYWQNPGDAGVPPELTVTGATVGPIAWPAPARQPEGPVMTYGYTGDVLLPVAAVAQGAAIDATASWLVCEKICVPEEGAFTLVPGGGAGPSAERALFTAADQRTPRPSPFTAAVTSDGTLTLAGEGLQAVRDAWFIPVAPDTLVNPAPQALQMEAGRVTLKLTPGPAFARPLAGVAVLRDAGGQESYWDVSADAASNGPGAATAPLAEALGLALLGGLILNLMPCVFPVLAMKAMAVARMTGTRAQMRLEGLAYTAGVLVAFGGLGLSLVALRQAGGAVGWGFQLQSPAFVIAMAWIMLALGLNLSGVFAVETRAAGAGQGLAAQDGTGGSFFTGLLAVLIATPCTAPFMGAAIAAALAAPAAVALLVFIALGLGFAAPYLLLALVPGVARLLPRPGAWMEVLRGVLAFPMYGAAAWLLWVVSLQAGPAGVLAGAAGAVVVAFGAWAWGQHQAGRLGRTMSYAILGGAGVGVLVILGALPDKAVAMADTGGVSQPFTRARLAALRAEGRPVFVNMTAAWCVTCLVNERIALAPASVQARFAGGVAYLKGDWTRQDPEISAFLSEHGRDGVPLYVFYPPQRPGIVLPQILTEGAVLGAMGPG